MYSNMCVKIALCLALIIVSIDGAVLRRRSVPLSPEGMTLEIVLRNKEDSRHPLSAMKIDINEKDKLVEISMAEAPAGVPKDVFKLPNNVPILESRNGMVVGTCAAGFTPRGPYCVPNDY